MKNVDRVSELDCIDRAVSIALVAFDNLQHTSTAKTLLRLGLVVLSTLLRQMQRIPKHILHVIRKGSQVLLRG